MLLTLAVEIASFACGGSDRGKMIAWEMEEYCVL
jgi:hypothetical protein